MTKKRFIAGAVCPACKQQDSLRWWKEQHVEVVECVGCGHTDRRSPTTSAPQEKDSQVIGIFKPR